MKLDAGKAADVQRTLDGFNTLAQQLGFGGTPTLVVLSSVGASVDNISVIPEFTQAADLQKAIDKAASTTKIISMLPVLMMAATFCIFIVEYGQYPGNNIHRINRLLLCVIINEW
ncbi:hypothetical protein ODH40_002960 [Salmonella enterica subsp. enterica]|nr:hypothetical protein [Salmonella enterica subsp. enterica]